MGSLFWEVLRLLPHHCASPPIPSCPFGGPEPGMIGLQSVAVKLFSFKSFFFGDLLSTPPFPILCCRPESNTKRPETSTVPIFGRQGSTFKSKAIYFWKGYSTFL